jgi:hypothetical protein
MYFDVYPLAFQGTIGAVVFYGKAAIPSGCWKQISHIKTF